MTETSESVNVNFANICNCVPDASVLCVVINETHQHFQRHDTAMVLN